MPVAVLRAAQASSLLARASCCVWTKPLMLLVDTVAGVWVHCQSRAHGCTYFSVGRPRTANTVVVCAAPVPTTCSVSYPPPHPHCCFKMVPQKAVRAGASAEMLLAGIHGYRVQVRARAFEHQQLFLRPGSPQGGTHRKPKAAVHQTARDSAESGQIG